MEKELLGSYSQSFEKFENVDVIYNHFQEAAFQALKEHQKLERIHQILLDLIQKARTPCFLLPAVLQFICGINQRKILKNQYRFTSFELWLNKFSKLSEDENLLIRGKIVGKYIPREEYQRLFPIGMGKTYPGSHFVAGHASPDIDTTVASFWGYIDAFGAKVAENLHYWSLPGILPESYFTKTFKELFSPSVFNELARASPALTLTAIDIMKANTAQEDISKTYITPDCNIEELRHKIEGLEHISVAEADPTGNKHTIGVINAQDVKRQVLGTVSLRDFSNEQETEMSSYLEVISVIDHHKTNLKTSSATCFHISDAQSSNTLTADLAFAINDRYSLLGLSPKTIEEELKASPEHDIQRLQALLQLKKNEITNANKYFVHPGREFAEYFTFLYAILDDTDLLTKVSKLDVDVVAMLLNKMKSLATGHYIEVISLEDLPRDKTYAKEAAKRILQNKDMYSIYSKIYEYKEKEVEENIRACCKGQESNIFSDTKEQNGCCSVGQTKIFNSNYILYQAHAEQLRSLWLEKAKKVYATKAQVDFHMHMISTVAGADEMHAGGAGNWQHQDEMWLWIPETDMAQKHLIQFLDAFSTSPAAASNAFEVEFSGSNSQRLAYIFHQHMPRALQKDTVKTAQELPLTILRFKPGSLNSRKAQITPYLPKSAA